MMIFEDKEEYEKAAIILKKIDKIKKLNNGSGKY
jgi:protein-arginine kinase activator protein McsA